MMPKFTERQYDVVKAPADVYAKLLRRYREQLPRVVPEHMGSDLSGVEGPVPADFFPQEVQIMFNPSKI